MPPKKRQQTRALASDMTEADPGQALQAPQRTQTQEITSLAETISLAVREALDKHLLSANTTTLTTGDSSRR